MENTEKLVKKKKNVPRNQKLYWRKYTATDDVEKFLDEKRLEERIGGPVKDKKNEELFVIDSNTNENATKLEISKLTKKQRALLPPRCLEILKPLTAVPDPIVKRNRVRTKEERKSSIRRMIEERKRMTGFISKKVIEARKSRSLTLLKKRLKPKSQEFKQDLWNCESLSNDTNEEMSEWVNEETVRHNLIHTQTFKVKVPNGIKKRKSVVPPVELPHPGTSYNPSLKDHHNLLKMVAERELERQKEEAHIKRVTTELFNKVTPTEKATTWMEEMSQGLPQTEEIKTEDEVKEIKDENTDYKAINPPTNFLKKKTRKQRRKQKLEKEAALARQKGKVEKKKVADLYKLRFISGNIEDIEKSHLKNLEKRQKLVELNVGRTKRLGGRQYEEQDITFSRSCELKGNLRSIRKMGNVLADRFYSLQKRNMLVPSVKRIGLKKGKVKKYVKASHKMENMEKNM